MNHEVVEKNVGLLAVLIILVISVAGLVQIVPLFFLNETTQAHEGVEPYPPLEFAGRDIYVREGCYNCHSQMVRPFRAETERYGHYSLASEFVYDRPFQWGSKRTGPDLHRVGGRYTDEWHQVHLTNPRDVLPNSNMPAYPWLNERELDGEQVAHRMRMQQRFLGVPYDDEMLDAAAEELEGKTEMDAIIAYLQGLGTAISRTR
ncbi:cytochrome c oxidase cbb3-type subunit 2 [Alkalispirillum mobile]|uniref:Cytochrome c oxidase cbb3-type subunit 2 n=1 Tax=Alkalispirillum mobile TaxID=85925 RepID=A0A498C3N6_9GAMM|nr:cytochrome-c oxidase, cbb3-type subunit II [Alkalispirillum mobile]RLK50744.1 cytochrome c oxidase cbb3-type subunit 2 [Alkalispirillum mobile]